MPRLELDINQPEFLPEQIMALHDLMDKHEQYQGEGRDLEARGVERSIGIVYRRFKGDFSDTQPTTHGELS